MSNSSNTRSEFLALMKQRILVLDGAMGTMIQALKLDEEGYRGARFDAWNREVRGNNDLLNLSRPEAVRDIHLAYFRAGADIVSTNTFSSTKIAQADYGMEGIAYELNQAGATLARQAAALAEKEDGRRRFVAGAFGPTNRTASISPDVSNPGFRAISFDQLRAAYGEQVRGLIEGGADLLLIETIFDTLNAKAAIYAISEICDELGRDLPVMISGTITDRSGRLLSGQTPAAFWNSVRHANPVTVGLNCALGAAEMRAHIAELGRLADTFVCAYPNAGLPNEFGYYDESPEYMAGAAWRIRRCRSGQCGRRLLRHHARAYRGHRESGRGQAAAQDPRGAAAVAAVRAGGVHAHAGNSLRQCRRAHQRHRLGQVPQADHRRRLRSGVEHRARSGGERRPGDRRQHGRGPARLRSRRW